MTTINLKHPVQLTPEGEKLTALTFRPMVFRDLKAFYRRMEATDEMTALGELAANLTGASAGQIDALSMDDTAAVMETVEGFLSAFEGRKRSKS